MDSRNGTSLVELYQSIRDAGTEIADRILLVKTLFIRTIEQLRFLEKVWPCMQPMHQRNQMEVLGTLKRILKKAKTKTEGLITKCGAQQRVRVRRWKYVLVKPFVDSTIRELSRWQKLYDPSWYLIMQVASPMIDDELKRSDPTRSAEGVRVLTKASRIRSVLRPHLDSTTHVILPAERLNGAVISKVPYSSATTVCLPGKSELLVVDSIPCPPGTYVGDISKDIRGLALKLKVVEPSSFGILKCRGVVKTFTANRARLASLELVFEPASSGQPCSLRSRLLSSPLAYSLTDRVQLAKQLAASVSYMHTLQFVHKNIRPENLIGFENSDVAKLMAFHLIGFEQIRSANGHTFMRGDDAWEKNLYRHPERQGPFPEETYSIDHDIYSLGVCLLEIGLWSSFVTYNADGGADSVGDALELSAGQAKRMRPRVLKEHLVALARRRLPSAMGDVYTEVVIECLTCLDDDDEDAQDEDMISDADDETDGIAVGVRFHEQVLQKLSEITV
ncbi:hypothetical protein LTR95_001597 [Oleoguttula sp. CCFEE 5521]